MQHTSMNTEAQQPETNAPTRHCNQDQGARIILLEHSLACLHIQEKAP